MMPATHSQRSPGGSSEFDGQFRVKLENYTEWGDEFGVVYMGACLRCQQPLGGNFRAKKRLFPLGIKDEMLARSVFMILHRRHKCGYTWTPWGYELNPDAKFAVPVIH